MLRRAAVVALKPQSLLSRAAVAPAATRLATAVKPAQFVRHMADERAPFIPKPVFSSYKIFKSKTALDIAVVRAQIGWNSPREEERKYLSLRRAGGFRLTFASGDNKSYDWEGAGLITLSVTELGDVLAFYSSKDVAEQKFFHDPALGSEHAGQTRKELVLKRIGGGKPGYFFNFAITEGGDRAAQKRYSIAVSEGEMAVLITLIQQTLPALLALHTKANIQFEDKTGGSGNAR